MERIIIKPLPIFVSIIVASIFLVIFPYILPAVISEDGNFSTLMLNYYSNLKIPLFIFIIALGVFFPYIVKNNSIDSIIFNTMPLIVGMIVIIHIITFIITMSF